MECCRSLCRCAYVRAPLCRRSSTLSARVRALFVRLLVVAAAVTLASTVIVTSVDAFVVGGGGGGIPTKNTKHHLHQQQSQRDPWKQRKATPSSNPVAGAAPGSRTGAMTASTTTQLRESYLSARALVDMNAYNVQGVEAIAAEWGAVVRNANAMHAGGVFLEPKNTRELFADTVTASFPRSGHGLGLELLELAGGRDDGRGITIISNVVAGGAADGSGILPGDSIVEIQIQTSNINIYNNGPATADSDDDSNQSGSNLEDRTTVTAIDTECLGYDATVDAILSLPEPSDGGGETVRLTVKRLRRKPKVQLKLQFPPDEDREDMVLELFAGENLRRAMLVRGVKLNDPLARRFDSGGSGDCGADGTCATCAVSVLRGQELLSPPGATEAQIFKNKLRWRMACRTTVGYGMQEGTISVRVNPRQWQES
jgi:ferredoxin